MKEKQDYGKKVDALSPYLVALLGILASAYLIISKTDIINIMTEKPKMEEAVTKPEIKKIDSIGNYNINFLDSGLSKSEKEQYRQKILQVYGDELGNSDSIFIQLGSSTITGTSESEETGATSSFSKATGIEKHKMGKNTFILIPPIQKPEIEK